MNLFKVLKLIRTVMMMCWTVNRSAKSVTRNQRSVLLPVLL